ncbi:MAG: hypothetical protein ACK5IP_03170 [Paracoccus sp. (in: a-proteobacteria)]
MATIPHFIPARHLALLALTLGLAGCAALNALKEAAEPVPQPCTAPPLDRNSLAGAYLRWPAVESQSFDAIFVTGSASRAGQPRSLQIGDLSLDRIGGGDAQGRGLRGSRGSTLKLQPGFGASGKLPNVYDLGYRATEGEFAGTVVLGPGPAGDEIPTSGTTGHGGRVVVQLGTPAGAGGAAVQAVGRFTLAAGYGTRRGTFTADLAGGGLPFSRITWSNLYLCGGRFVSSGQGEVLVTDGGGTHPPFRSGAEPVPLVSHFEAALIAPPTRPGPPTGAGGVFAVQSDLGAITGVFLSDQPGAAP